MLTSSTIKKYEKYSVAELLKKCQTVFNAWIRFRDKDLGCISCGAWSNPQAGHYLSQGHHSALRFNENNVNRQCLKCNNFLHGNLINYRIGLVKKIGEARVQSLEDYPKAAHKWNRFDLILKIEDYKTRLKGK